MLGLHHDSTGKDALFNQRNIETDRTVLDPNVNDAFRRGSSSAAILQEGDFESRDNRIWPREKRRSSPNLETKKAAGRAIHEPTEVVPSRWTADGRLSVVKTNAERMPLRLPRKWIFLHFVVIQRDLLPVLNKY
jgi:hypothetical protein